MSHKWDNLGLKAVNVVSFALFFSSNAYAALVPRDAGWGAGPHETYLTPAAWLFVTWPIIHTLLLGMLVYQFTDAGYEPVVKTVGWRFPVLAVLVSIYSYWNSRPTNEHPHRLSAVLAFGALLAAAAVVSAIYRDVRQRTKSDPSAGLLRATSWAETLFVQWPFSLYHGFNAVLLAVAAFSAFGVNANKHKPGVITDISAFITLLCLEATAAGYVVRHSPPQLLGAGIDTLFSTMVTATRAVRWLSQRACLPSQNINKRPASFTGRRSSSLFSASLLSSGRAPTPSTAAAVGTPQPQTRNVRPF